MKLKDCISLHFFSNRAWIQIAIGQHLRQLTLWFHQRVPSPFNPHSKVSCCECIFTNCILSNKVHWWIQHQINQWNCGFGDQQATGVSFKTGIWGPNDTHSDAKDLKHVFCHFSLLQFCNTFKILFPHMDGDCPRRQTKVSSTSFQKGKKDIKVIKSAQHCMSGAVHAHSQLGEMRWYFIIYYRLHSYTRPGPCIWAFRFWAFFY